MEVAAFQAGRRHRKIPIAVSPPKDSQKVTGSGRAGGSVGALTLLPTTTPPELAPVVPPVRTIAISTLAKLYAAGFGTIDAAKL
jgi:hypothetical protein